MPTSHAWNSRDPKLWQLPREHVLMCIRCGGRNKRTEISGIYQNEGTEYLQLCMNYVFCNILPPDLRILKGTAFWWDPLLVGALQAGKEGNFSCTISGNPTSDHWTVWRTLPLFDWISCSSKCHMCFVWFV